MSYAEKVFIKRVRFICELYEGANYALGDTLADRYTNQLHKSFQLTADSTICAFLDTTSIGHWMEGAVVCTEGVVLKNEGSYPPPAPFVIDWKTMLQLTDPELTSDYDVSIADGRFEFNMWNSSFPADRFVRLLCDLRDGLQPFRFSEPIAEPGDTLETPVMVENYKARIIDL